MTDHAPSDCGALLAGVSAYLDGDADAAACEAIQRHCRDCAGCAAVVEGLRETIGLCREAGTAPLPDPVRRRAKASIDRLLASAKLPGGDESKFTGDLSRRQASGDSRSRESDSNRVPMTIDHVTQEREEKKR